MDSKEALKHLYQGRQTAAKYASTFKQHASRTGHSDADLRDRFYEHLADCVKDGLVNSANDTDTLQDLIEEAIRIDNRQVTRAVEKGRHIVDSPFSGSINPTPFMASARDPNAMDVDATTTTRRSSNDFNQMMRG
ncbi:hypothetical protein BT96DRAFT_950189 [Gymnopus androsaceus JB14]|uniref:Retrotransposon gag domain-containing protein n=1 Tax=Gymnopus androsaceus JB14 TaxID=1447944 RepID=A0A6A4GHY4_9AGAR|nr:hypothetical protein BT96DRAFT_950189 [Gymnopus androsaceus JB14]